jgi:type I restriction enzyme M protein
LAVSRPEIAIRRAIASKLYGIFGDTQWSNKDRLPDSLLRDLIDHYSKLQLSNDRVELDVLGNAYEYLIKKFADLTNKKAGEFYTPRSVVKMQPQDAPVGRGSLAASEFRDIAIAAQPRPRPSVD